MVLKEDARAFYLSHADSSLNEPKTSSEVLYPIFLRTLLFEELSPNHSNGSPSCSFSSVAILNCLRLPKELSVLQKENRCPKNP